MKEENFEMNVNKNKDVRMNRNSEESAMKVSLNGRRMEKVKTYKNKGGDVKHDRRARYKVNHRRSKKTQCTCECCNT